MEEDPETRGRLDAADGTGSAAGGLPPLAGVAEQEVGKVTAEHATDAASGSAGMAADSADATVETSGEGEDRNRTANDSNEDMSKTVAAGSIQSWSAEEKQFQEKQLRLFANGDKSLAFATSFAQRTEAFEKRKWMSERLALLQALDKLKAANARYQEAKELLAANNREEIGLDANGDFVKKHDVEKVQNRLDLLVAMADRREKSDRAAIEAQDLITALSRLPLNWLEWEPPLEATDFVRKLEKARVLIDEARQGYKQIEDWFPELEESDNEEREGRTMGWPFLEKVMVAQLEGAEEQARHRLAGDMYLEDAHQTIRGEMDETVTSYFCQKMFLSIDEDGSGAIDAEELKDALWLLKVYLSDDDVQKIVKDIDVDRNGTIERQEWERGIVMAKYKVFLHIAMANSFIDLARKEYEIASAPDRIPSLFSMQEKIDKITPIGVRERIMGALWGTACGDSLGLPGDNAVNLRAQERDYGYIEDLIAPYKGTHADGGMHLGVNARLRHLGTESSSLYPKQVLEPTRKSDIMGDTERFHYQRGVHPHRGLKAGNNTLNGSITRMLVNSIRERERFDRDHFLDMFINFMLTTPKKDVNIDAIYIEFFERYSKGNKPYYSAGMGAGAAEMTSIALVHVTPLIVFLIVQEDERDRMIILGEGKFAYSNLRYSARHASPCVIADGIHDTVYQYVQLFFRNEKLQQYAYNWATLMKRLLLGYDARGELEEAARRDNVDLATLSGLSDEEVVGLVYGNGNQVDHCVPCVLFLALKYLEHPVEGMCASANLGGDAANRTALLGAVFGAIHGYTCLPLKWREGLAEHQTFEEHVAQFVHKALVLRAE